MELVGWLLGWLVGCSLTSLFSTNTAISESSPDGVAPSRMVGVSASVILPCTIKSRIRFFWHLLTRVVLEKGIKRLCVCVCVVCFFLEKMKRVCCSRQYFYTVDWVTERAYHLYKNLHQLSPKLLFWNELRMNRGKTQVHAENGH